MIHRNAQTCLFAVLVLFPFSLTAEEFTVSPLTEDEQSVLRSIQEMQIRYAVKGIGRCGKFRRGTISQGGSGGDWSRRFFFSDG
jgi:hypothetical protein